MFLSICFCPSKNEKKILVDLKGIPLRKLESYLRRLSFSRLNKNGNVHYAQLEQTINVGKFLRIEALHNKRIKSKLTEQIKLWTLILSETSFQYELERILELCY